jgi:uncharacterized iron-regulated protein
MLAGGGVGQATFLGVARADNQTVPEWPGAWAAPELRDHPLAGRIWSRAQGGFVSAQDYGMQLAKSRFVLLGEVHDNPDHHRLQAWAIDAVIRLRGARAVDVVAQMNAVAMEMLSADEHEAIDRFYGRNARVPRPRTPADFGRLVKWDKLGWPPYEIYRPIIEAALNAHLVITPANPARAESRKVSREGLGALAADVVARLGLDRPLTVAQDNALAVEIRESHCGMLPETAIPNMSAVQRLRDARMADALLHSQSKGATLIAGNGHVRRDRAVPWYLAARGVADKDIAAVRHIEVEVDKTAPEDYDLGVNGQGEAADLADFVVFTPRQPRPEACEEMRQQMEAIKAKRRAAKEPAGGAPTASGAPPEPR